VSARLSPNGTIIASLEFKEFRRSTDLKEVPLAQLVDELLEPHNLSLEEIRAPDLEALLRSLEASIQLVKAAMADLVVHQKRASSLLT